MTFDPSNNALYAAERQRNSLDIFQFHYTPRGIQRAGFLNVAICPQVHSQHVYKIPAKKLFHSP
jgi:hypothetical protein